MRKQIKLFLFFPLLTFLFLLLLVIYKKRRLMKTAVQRVASSLSKEQRRFILAVSMHETGNFNSRLFREFNNGFGMKPAKKRTKFYSSSITLNNETFAVYTDAEQSVKDFINWFEWQGFEVPSDPIRGVQLMKSRGYFTDSLENYTKGVKYYYGSII